MGRLEQAGRCQIDISGLLLTSDTSVNAQIILNLSNRRSDQIWKDIHGARPTWLSLVNIDHFHLMASRRSRSAARASQGEGPEKSAMSRLRERLAPSHQWSLEIQQKMAWF